MWQRLSWQLRDVRARQHKASDLWEFTTDNTHTQLWPAWYKESQYNTHPATRQCLHPCEFADDMKDKEFTQIHNPALPKRGTNYANVGLSRPLMAPAVFPFSLMEHVQLDLPSDAGDLSSGALISWPEPLIKPPLSFPPAFPHTFKGLAGIQNEPQEFQWSSTARRGEPGVNELSSQENNNNCPIKFSRQVEKPWSCFFLFFSNWRSVSYIWFWVWGSLKFPMNWTNESIERFQKQTSYTHDFSQADVTSSFDQQLSFHTSNIWSYSL